MDLCRDRDAWMWPGVQALTWRAADAVADRLRDLDLPAAGGPAGLELAELEILYRLTVTEDATCRIGHLSSVVLPDKNKITRTVDRLFANGLLRRHPDPGDRRVVLVTLTETGRDVLTVAGTAWAAGIRDVLGPLPIGLLTRLQKPLDTLILANQYDLSDRYGRATETDWTGRARPILRALLTREAGTPRIDDRHGAAWIALLRVTAVVREALDTTLTAEQHLSLTDYEALHALTAGPQQRLTMSELAATAHLTASGATRLADRLLRDGLVTRTPHPTSRRVVYCQALPAALDRVAAAGPGYEQTLRTTLLDHLSDTDRATLHEVVTTLTPAA